jgi:hypothetical protein
VFLVDEAHGYDDRLRGTTALYWLPDLLPAVESSLRTFSKEEQHWVCRQFEKVMQAELDYLAQQPTTQPVQLAPGAREGLESSLIWLQERMRKLEIMNQQ